MRNEEKIAAVRAQYRDVVKEAIAVRAGSSFVLVLHVLRQRILERHVTTVTCEGAMEDTLEVSAETPAHRVRRLTKWTRLKHMRVGGDFNSGSWSAPITATAQLIKHSAP